MKRFDTAFLMILILLFISSSTVLGQHFEPATDQGASHSLVISSTEINGEELTNDDEIAVFTPDGVCAGVVIINDEPPWGLAAFGDNPNTLDEVEGFLSGEEFAFRFWDNSTQTDEELHIDWGGEPQVWASNGVSDIFRLFYFEDPVPVINLSAAEHNFQTMGIDHTREWTLTITNIGFGVLTIEDVSLNNQAFGTDFENEVEIGVYESYDLLVNFTPFESGNVEGTLTIVNDDSDNEEAQVTLTGTGTDVIEPNIIFDYDAIDFGEFPVRRFMAKTLRVTVGNDGTGELTISNAVVSGDDVFDVVWDGEVVLQPWEEYILEVSFEPDDENTDYEGTLTVTSDDPDDEEVDFDLNGRGAETESYYIYVQTSVSHSILIDTTSRLNDDYLDVLDEVAVFTPEGLCAGAGTVTRRVVRFGCPAMGRDGQADGFRRNGDEIEFRIWDASAEVEYILEPEGVDFIHGPDVYSAESFSVVTLTAETPDEPIIDVSEFEIDYGEIGVDFTEEMEIIIRNIGIAQLRVPYVESSEPDIFYPDFEVGFVLDHMEERMISIIFEPPDTLDYEAQIGITSNATEDPVLIDVFGSGIEPPAIIQIEDRAHDFGQIERGTEDTWELLITNIGWEDLTIDSLISDNEAFTHDFGDQAVVLERDDEITVTVTFSAAEAQEYDGILTVYNDDPDEDDQVIEIELLGEGILVPDIRLSDMSIDFGEVEILTDSIYVLTISNEGEANLNVTDVTMRGGDGNFFDTDYDGEFTVEPNAEHDIEISFSPIQIRDYAAEVHVISNDLDEEDMRVRLSGTGIYVAHDPEVEHAIPDQELTEDFDEFIVADLDTVFIDLNNEDMDFSYVVEPNNLHLDIRNSSKLWLWADENWNGSGTVTVTADDGINRDNGGPVRSLRSTDASTPVDLNSNSTNVSTPVALNSTRVLRNSWGIESPTRDGSVDDEFDVTVEAENDEPVWTFVPDPITENENVEIAFTVEGEDVDE
ncbi:MAG: choice-of-anchor D domain-containing protein, partial [Calditrichaeota bacterium]|nr:choice-of-anchor D domain-containing protein [Calditrichota bacterium]